MNVRFLHYYLFVYFILCLLGPFLFSDFAPCDWIRISLAWLFCLFSEWEHDTLSVITGLLPFDAYVSRFVWVFLFVVSACAIFWVAPIRASKSCGPVRCLSGLPMRCKHLHGAERGRNQSHDCHPREFVQCLLHECRRMENTDERDRSRSCPKKDWTPQASWGIDDCRW